MRKYAWPRPRRALNRQLQLSSSLSAERDEVVAAAAAAKSSYDAEAAAADARARAAANIHSQQVESIKEQVRASVFQCSLWLSQAFPKPLTSKVNAAMTRSRISNLSHER